MRIETRCGECGRRVVFDVDDQPPQQIGLRAACACGLLLRLLGGMLDIVRLDDDVAACA